MTAETSAQIEALARVPDDVEQLIARTATTASTGEGWSAAEIVGHLCDSARYWGARMLLAVHEDLPQLKVFDENAMVQLAAWRYRPLDMLLRDFRSVSEHNVAFLRSLPAAAFERAGMHEVRGRITLADMVAAESSHELGHVNQLRETLGGGN